MVAILLRGIWASYALQVHLAHRQLMLGVRAVTAGLLGVVRMPTRLKKGISHGWERVVHLRVLKV